MFGLGVWEVIVVLLVALLVLGPTKLPQFAKQAGRALREFRRAASDFQHNLEEAAEAETQRHGPPAVHTPVVPTPAEHLVDASGHDPALQEEPVRAPEAHGVTLPDDGEKKSESPS